MNINEWLRNHRVDCSRGAPLGDSGQEGRYDMTYPQFKRVPGWKQNDYKTDVRVAWCEWIDDMYQSDQISKGLVERATL